MNLEEYLKELILLKSASIKAFSEEIDIPYTTMHTILKRGVMNANVNNVIKICEGLDITPEHLISFNNQVELKKIDEVQTNTMLGLAEVYEMSLETKEEFEQLKEELKEIKSSKIHKTYNQLNNDNKKSVVDFASYKLDEQLKEEKVKEIPSKYDENGLPKLTAKDERDVQKELNRMFSGNSAEGFAAFTGEAIDDMSETDRELLYIAMEEGLKLAKQKAKAKFTPKKYRDK